MSQMAISSIGQMVVSGEVRLEVTNCEVFVDYSTVCLVGQAGPPLADPAVWVLGMERGIGML